MSATKKRLKKLAEAVSAILGDTEKAKQLKKSKALERFIGRLEDRQRELERDLEKGSVEDRKLKETSKKHKMLTKQIKKARKILSDMKD